MEVELPDGKIAEFPDEMPHEQIEAVLKNHYASHKSTTSDKQQAFGQIKQRFPGMPEALIHALMPIATKMAETPKDLNPGTSTGAFLRSAARNPLEGAENFASILGLPVDRNAQFPSLIAESESDKSHPFAELGGGLAGFLAPGAGTIGALRSIPLWEKIAQKASGSLLRRAPVYAGEGAALGGIFSPEGERSKGALEGAALGAVGSTIPSVAKGFTGLGNRISSLRNLDRLRHEGKISQEQYNHAVKNEESLKDLLKRQGLQGHAGELEAQLPEQKELANQLTENINNTPEVILNNMLPAPTGEDIVPNAENILKTHAQKMAEKEQNISSFLGEGNAHRKQVARILNPILEQRQTEIGKGFNEYIEDLKDKNVTLTNGRDAKAITAELKNAISKGGFESSEVKKLAQELEEIGKNKSDKMPADRFVAAYRTLQGMANKTRSSAYGKNPEEFNRLTERANEMDADVKRMEDIIDNGLGTENIKNLNTLKHRYATEVAPLFKNKFYQHLQANNKAPTNMMEQLTNEPYVRSTNPNKVTGTQILNNIIKNNPELLKNVIGERYAHKPHELPHFDETANEYIDHLPEIKQHINEYKQLLNENKSHIENVARAKIKSQEEAQEAERVNKGYKETQKQQELRQNNVSKLKEINEKINALERYIPELKKSSNAKNISLRKKMDIESKISKAEKDRNKLILYAIGLGASISGTILGTSGLIKKLNPF